MRDRRLLLGLAGVVIFVAGFLTAVAFACLKLGRGSDQAQHAVLAGA